MQNRIPVRLGGEEYTLCAEEAPSYMEKLAREVDGRFQHILTSTNGSRMDAALLTALNLADELAKKTELEENLRVQLKQALDASSAAQSEISELKREVFRLQNRAAGGAARH